MIHEREAEQPSPNIRNAWLGGAIMGALLGATVGAILSDKKRRGKARAFLQELRQEGKDLYKDVKLYLKNGEQESPGQLEENDIGDNQRLASRAN